MCQTGLLFCKRREQKLGRNLIGPTAHSWTLPSIRLGLLLFSAYALLSSQRAQEYWIPLLALKTASPLGGNPSFPQAFPPPLNYQNLTFPPSQQGLKGSHGGDLMPAPVREISATRFWFSSGRISPVQFLASPSCQVATRPGCNCPTGLPLGKLTFSVDSGFFRHAARDNFLWSYPKLEVGCACSRNAGGLLEVCVWQKGYFFAQGSLGLIKLFLRKNFPWGL